MEDPRIQKLRDAGFNDQDIAEYLASSPPPTASASAASSSEPPSVSPEVPATAPADVAPEPTWLERGATALKAIAPENLTDAATKAGEGYLAYKGIQAWKQSSQAAQAKAAADALTEQGRQARFNAKYPPIPEAAPAAAAEAAPAAAEAPVARTPSVIQRGMDYARQMQRIAAEKVMQGAQAAGEGLASAGRAAAPYARAAAAPVAVGLTAALMPGNAGGAGMMVPQTGRLRGSDLNPMTGRPWTRQELDAYNANPNIIDSRLPR